MISPLSLFYNSSSTFSKQLSKLDNQDLPLRNPCCDERTKAQRLNNEGIHKVCKTLSRQKPKAFCLSEKSYAIAVEKQIFRETNILFSYLLQQ